MAKEFIAPDFISGQSAEEIQQRMMNELPEDIDRMPGGFAYDMTMPTALEKSEAINYHLVRAIMIAFPEWSWDDWLDLHAKQRGLTRRPAGYASGYVTITGRPGIKMAAGFVVCTPATDDSASILYALDEETTIPETGTVTTSVTALTAGTTGNVQAGSVTIMASPIEGIESINNDADITGGTERESDESLRERLEAVYASEGASYIGNDTDYIRWAEEVVGVGECIVMAAWNGPGTVKLALTDSNGDPANEAICEAVYNHILSPDDRAERLMPTGSCELTVVPANTVTVNFTVSGLELADGFTTSGIQTAFETALRTYFREAHDESEVKYVKTHAVMVGIDGVDDFSGFLMNNGTANIELSPDELPVIGTVTMELA